VLKGFREFILRGNIVDLAVGVVIGVAFNDLVTKFTAESLEHCFS
jgi:large conductance mechanosensitive channel